MLASSAVRVGGGAVQTVEQRPFPFFHGHIRDATARQLVQSQGYGAFLVGFTPQSADRFSIFSALPPGAAAAASEILSEAGDAPVECGALVVRDDITVADWHYRIQLSPTDWYEAMDLAELLEKLMVAHPNRFSVGVPSQRSIHWRDMVESHPEMASRLGGLGASRLLVAGSSQTGQLGIGSVSTSIGFCAVPGLGHKVTHVALGEGHTIATTCDGVALSWGSNLAGQLGLGIRGGHVNSPRQIPALMGHYIAAVAAGSYHSIFLSAFGDVLCVGDNSSGSLGTGNLQSCRTPLGLAYFTRRPFQHSAGPILQRVPTISSARMDSISDSSIRNLIAESLVDDLEWMTEDGTTGSAARPPSPGSMTSAGRSFRSVTSVIEADASYASKADDRAVCSEIVQRISRMGSVRTTDEDTTAFDDVVISIDELSTQWDSVINVAAKGESSFAITKQGKVYAWGGNSKGQLGVGTAKNALVPTLITDLQQMNIQQVAPGFQHTLFVNQLGELYACGNGTFGRLGLGPDERDRLAPARVRGELEHRRVHVAACGSKHSIVATDAGDLFVFGDNAYAQLGLARIDTPDVRPECVSSAACVGPRFAEVLQASRRCNVPTQLPVLETFFSTVSAGDKYSVAVDSKGGSIWAWGSYESSFCPSPLDHEKLHHYARDNKADPASDLHSVLSACRQAVVLPSPSVSLSPGMSFGDVAICASASAMAVLSPENALEMSCIFPLLMVPADAPLAGLPPLEHDALCWRASTVAFVESSAAAAVEARHVQIEIHPGDQLEASPIIAAPGLEIQPVMHAEANVSTTDAKIIATTPQRADAQANMHLECSSQAQTEDIAQESFCNVSDPPPAAPVQLARSEEKHAPAKALAAVESNAAVPVAAVTAHLSWWQRCICCH